MTKDDYVKDKFVAQFIEWMSAKLDDETFAHGYTMRRTGQRWTCTSIFNAYEKYQWRHSGVPSLGVPRGDTFESNAAALAALRAELISALAAGDDNRVCAAACAIVIWGGVGPGNLTWLTANKLGLAALIAAIRDALDANDSAYPGLMAADLRFTSGMSKVYSLACKRFVIYDSRVAAALGLAVVRFCREAGLEAVPAGLQFPWAPPNAAPNADNPPMRDPRVNNFDFLRLRSGAQHAKWNLFASWVLAAIVEKLDGGNSGFAKIEAKADRLRALEAALFMIGYDLGRKESGDGSGANNAALPAPNPQDGDDGAWTECYTPKHGNPFQYRIDDRGIATNGPLRFNDDLINRTLTRLYVHFGADPFPLANNAVNVPAGIEQMGLGVAYVDAGGNNAPNTSKLAAILQDLNVLVRCYDAPGNGAHWTLNKDALGLVDGRVNIRPWLDERRNDE